MDEKETKSKPTAARSESKTWKETKSKPTIADQKKKSKNINTKPILKKNKKKKKKKTKKSNPYSQNLYLIFVGL